MYHVLPLVIWVDIVRMLPFKDKVEFLRTGPWACAVVTVQASLDAHARDRFLWRLIETDPRLALHVLLRVKRHHPDWWRELTDPEDVPEKYTKMVAPRHAIGQRRIEFTRRKANTGRLAPVIHKLGDHAGDATGAIARLLGFAGRRECPMTARRWCVGRVDPRQLAEILSFRAPLSTPEVNINQGWCEIVRRANELATDCDGHEGREKCGEYAAETLDVVARCPHLPISARALIKKSPVVG